MSLIHPTAVVSPKAQIDSSVSIGPYTVIGENVKIGARTKIGSHTVIEGCTAIGEDNTISHFTSLGGAPQDMKYRGEPTELQIGNHNTIREFTTIHTGTIQDHGVTKIGHHNWIMAYVHIAHDCVVGDHTIFSSNAQVAGHVIVGDWAILGGMSGVHQFVRIGQHAMLGGASALVQDIPPYVIAAGDKAQPHGLNAEGLKRRGFSREAITAIRHAYKVLYKSGLTLEEAKAALEVQEQSEPEFAVELKLIRDFLQNVSRGIVR